ncbi:MAG TPA: hypothetical protein VMC07_01855 [Candidatus Omnitrophota bacterium]|nr:hypothetical protein [Candidatus Omnitrophota bacterium]
MKDNLEVIVVPSGSVEEDSNRMKTAIAFGLKRENESQEVRYILSGVGPDLNKRLMQEGKSLPYSGPFQNTNGLNVHPELYSSGVETARLRFIFGEGLKPIGIDTLSVNSVENMVNTFTPGTEGNYTIVSRALHNARFKMIEKELRKIGYLSSNLRISYVNTPNSFSIKNIAYDLLALAKFFANKGKIKSSIHA